jgi:hypothetical protein
MQTDMNTTGATTTQPGIVDIDAAIAFGSLTAADLEQADEAIYEHKMLCIAHPEPEDQLLHRHNECDGSCTRFSCFR